MMNLKNCQRVTAHCQSIRYTINGVSRVSAKATFLLKFVLLLNSDSIITITYVINTITIHFDQLGNKQ